MEKDIEITNLNEIKEKLWKACDQMRGNISSEQYMHIIIAIIFLKTLSDKKDYAYQQFSKEFESESDEKRLKKWDIIKDDLEFLDKYGIKFLVPSEASWEEITKYIGTSELGTKIDEAFLAIEKKWKS
ncbi:RESTRICTION-MODIFICATION ENZYME SUBUNIT M3 (FRAGMENT) [Mycoplasmopsis pulmonis]|uniref:RESTRICTION-MODIFICATION ENZYME SUBUNIT M3 n=1 Tax=Mycoplasmopsis pulmonis (strain UAB CTIP) TaxID=272635 RepID=Q98RC8_MYCPU